MASNSLGSLFRITTWGESHGKALGVVIDGCPAGLLLCEADINHVLLRRRPGSTQYTTARAEPDEAHIYSGVFEGKTTGAPISIIIFNQDIDSTSYEATKDQLRPGHAQFTYREKYGVFDYRGSGRASARETVCRVAAGAVAAKLLKYYGIECYAYLSEVANIRADINRDDVSGLRSAINESPIFCPDTSASEGMMKKITEARTSGDSLGGTVTFVALQLPVGLGDPVYEKLEANLAKAMLGLPASKGFELGAGFGAVGMMGSEHNDLFTYEQGVVRTKTNHAGGVLGGISTGMPLYGRVAFKPTSSIAKTQTTLDTAHQETVLALSQISRHDPCVAIRAVPVVEAMCALVLADAWLMNKSAVL